MRRQDIQLRVLARNGDVGARLEVGRRYLVGSEGFPRHAPTGIDYLTHPSVGDMPKARTLIAECLSLHELLLLGQKESLRKAALAGSALAQFKFGTYLLTHVGRQADAAAYYARAAAGAPAAAAALALCESDAGGEPLPAILRLLISDKKENGCAVAEFAAREARTAQDLPRLRLCLHAAAVLMGKPTSEMAELVVALVNMAEHTGGSLQGMPVVFIQASLEMQSSQGSLDATYTLGRALSGIPCGAIEASSLADNSNLRKGTALLLRAADAGRDDAWLHLYKLNSDHRSSVANPQMARFFLEKAAERGQAEAQRKLGALLLRESGSITESEQAIAWLYRSTRQGDLYARQLLNSLVLPVSGSDSQASAALGELDRSDPWLAMRLRLARHFGLTKLEALAVDPAEGARPWGLVVGRNPFIAQIRLAAPRAIPALSDEALADLERAVALFGGAQRSGGDSEGDLRRRSLNQRRAFERHNLDESLFFATAKSTVLDSLRIGPKWAFRARDTLQLALVA
jgi:TPR repeat protein